MEHRDKRKRMRGQADQDQYRRFKEAARELGCEEDVDRIDEAVRRAAKLPPPRRESPPEKPRKEPREE